MIAICWKPRRKHLPVNKQMSRTGVLRRDLGRFIVPDLSDDEWTCLMIAAEGESMMAIARWEPAIDSLVAKGLMYRNDKFNNFITPAGREAAQQHEKKTDDATLRLGIEVHNTRVRAKQILEEAAAKLAESAQMGQRVQGGPIDGHVEQAAKAIIERAKELVR